MILSLLAAAALAAPSLTVRRDCDAAGGLPTASEPLVVRYAAEDGSVSGELKLGTLASTTADTNFAILLTGALAEVRTFVLVAHDVDGNALGKAIVDVDAATGEVLAQDGAGLSVSRFVASRGEEGAYDVGVTLDGKVAEHAALVTLTDVTGDGATVEGSAFEQAIALSELSDAGRGLVGRYTFDDAHGIDSSRQQWHGEIAIDPAYDRAAFTFSASADRCLPEGVVAPADGAVEWAETLVLQGSARAPKWKSVTLGLKEAETETWVWPFVARVAGTPQWVMVSLDALDGAVAPRTSEMFVRVPARETLSGTGSLGRLAGTETLSVSVHRYGIPSRPLTNFEITRTPEGVTFETTSYLEINDEKDVIAIYDHTRETYLFAAGPGRAGRGASATYDGETYALSTVTLSGPEEVDWDGTIEMSVSGDAAWADLQVTAELTGGGATTKATFPLASLEAVFEGVFVFDADPSGGTYRWECVGCGDDYDPFDIQAQFGTGTRSTAGQCHQKTELL